MGITVDVTYKNLSKYIEVLCGDKAELLQTEDSNVMILTDSMGNGVKTNILSTLTSKILGTMFPSRATLEECVNTISETLPICQIRQMAYSTFNILQVYYNGDAYLVEYDSPGCIFIRDGKLMQTPKNVRVMQGEEISEHRFKVEKDDTLIPMNDGIIHAGVGELLNFGWLWQGIADYAVRQYLLAMSAMCLAANISRVCDGLCQFRLGDDTTATYMRIIDSKSVHLITGPARDPGDDIRVAQDSMGDPNARAVMCGGTNVAIVFRVLGKKLDVSLDYVDPKISPTTYIEGVDLVTEGVLTLNRVLQLLRRYVKNETISKGFFRELNKPNGDSMVAKVLIKDCTEVCLYMGEAINSAYRNPGLSFDLGIRQNLMEQLGHVIEEVGKTVVVTYY